MSYRGAVFWRLLLIVGFVLQQLYSGLVEVSARHHSSHVRHSHASYGRSPSNGDYVPGVADFPTGSGYNAHPSGPRSESNNRNVWAVNSPANIPYGRQNPQNPQNPLMNRRNEERMQPNEQRSERKCKIWAPAESLSSYGHYTLVSADRENPSIQMIEICCPGYEDVVWQNVHYCRPVCENCRNGHCVAPDVCECFEEFVANDNGDCVYTCPLGCLNGRCYLDGSCQCNPGYKLDESRKFCRPICSAGCGLNPRHNCTEPEVCGCAKGYQLSDTGCMPTCQPDCGVGGICEDSNYCRCRQDRGYTLKDGVCQADCYQKCDNGVCFSRNRCICNPGYKYHESSSMCVPV